MPGFTPGRRWQPAYYPFHKDPLFDRFVETIERTLKGFFFGCRMCGNCLLQETSFICPMECPKGLRNGPCGGSTPAHCYVDPTRPCIWYKIYERSERLGRNDRLLEILPPLDWNKVGTDTWMDGVHKVQELGGIKWALKFITSPDKERKETFERFFFEIRQPNWWQGDALPHPAPAHEPVSGLEAKLTAGKFVVTAEVSPPLVAAPDEVIKKVNMLREYVDAVNFTDNPSATPRMSSLVCSLIALQNGLEPVIQIASRDRTRMGIQAEILGAAALGIRNILCLTGDHSRMGPSPCGRMDIWDMDSIQILWMLRRMRDDCHFLDEREIKCAPPLFLGAAGSPNASEVRFQAIREQKKVNAGAQFMQTNLVYDVERFEHYLEALDQRGVLGRVSILVGVSPIRSVKAAQVMSQIPGIKIPPQLIERMEKSADPKEEGVQIGLEIVEKIKRLPIQGIHFMSVAWESIVPRMVKESGVRDI